MATKDVVETLPKLFEDKYFTLIPSQRPYSWQKQHVEDYWNDIISINKVFASSQNEQVNYFMGYIVLMPNKECKYTPSGQKIHGYSITDGQQRLTTTVLFIVSLMKQFKSLQYDHEGSRYTLCSSTCIVFLQLQC